MATYAFTYQKRETFFQNGKIENYNEKRIDKKKHNTEK